MPSTPRARDLGVVIGEGIPGPLNAITDVAGVRVGHTTLISGDGPLVVGQGPVRTGVTVIVPHDGVYSVWIGGSFSARVRIYVDGKLVGSRRNGLEWEQYQQLGSVRLTAGQVHDVRLVYDGTSLLHPGSGDAPTPIGPLAFASQTADVPVTYVPATQARSLCGHYLDWVEAIGPG